MAQAALERSAKALAAAAAGRPAPASLRGDLGQVPPLELARRRPAGDAPSAALPSEASPRSPAGPLPPAPAESPRSASGAQPGRWFWLELPHVSSCE